MSRKKEIYVVLNILLLAFFIIIVTFVSVKFYNEVYRLISEPENFRQLLLSYGRGSVLVFILFQVLQVVIATIPGEFVQIAGGFIYGTVAGTLYSALGIMLGYCIVFTLTRLIGYPLVKLFLAESKIEKLKKLIQTKQSDTLLFFLFLVPGIPKDFLVYAAGLTPVEPVRFFTIVLMARFPALLGASFIGANIEQKNYIIVIITFIISILLFIGGFLLKRRIIPEATETDDEENPDSQQEANTQKGDTAQASHYDEKSNTEKEENTDDADCTDQDRCIIKSFQEQKDFGGKDNTGSYGNHEEENLYDG